MLTISVFLIKSVKYRPLQRYMLLATLVCYPEMTYAMQLRHVIRAAVMTTQGTTSVSGLMSQNVTCETFYQFVIEAIQSLNGASQDDARSVQ